MSDSSTKIIAKIYKKNPSTWGGKTTTRRDQEPWEAWMLGRAMDDIVLSITVDLSITVNNPAQLKF